jgi:hypothetical protein
MLTLSRVARFFLAQHTKNGGNYTKIPQNIPNDIKLYHLTVKYGYKNAVNIPTFSSPRPSKIYKKLFWFENCTPSGNPESVSAPKFSYLRKKDNEQTQA